MRWRDILVAGLVSFATVALTALPAFDRLEGLSIDALFWLRHQGYGPLRHPGDSPSVVIAIDEETYRRPPFEGLPKAMWTPQLARVIEATLEGGARVIGHDVILSTSVESHLPGFDRAYLIALGEGARQGRIVLGKVQHLNKPISPFPGYSFAVDHQQNIRLVNLFRDRDGTIRRIPLLFRNFDPGGTIRAEPSMALELATRALGVGLETGQDGSLKLGDYEIPNSTENALLLNFDTGGQAIPVFSLADLYACAEAGHTEFFHDQFGGKVVLIGSVLDVEDRKITSQRFATGPEGAWLAKRCLLPMMGGLYDEKIVRDSIPAVFIHATAVNNLVRREALRELSPPLNAAVVLVLTLAAAAVTMTLRPWLAVIALTGTAVVWAAIATVVFRETLVLPLFAPPMTAAITFAAILGYRFAVVDREKREIGKAFSYYLPSSVIDRMLQSHQNPSLGGETRELTVWFSDLAGFTTLSEGMAPEDVVRLLNRYLSEMTEIIEARGGFVEKYMGDGIIAVFGAPRALADHAQKAAEAALACQRRGLEIEPKLSLPAGHRLVVRIGINTGEMLIGNIGSAKRFNYSVMGDSVNLASRLEGVNKIYGTAILASERSARLCGSAVVFREIDTVRVLGKREPLRIYEPLGLRGEFSPEQLARLQQFADALAHFRARRFRKAAEDFASLAADDQVAQSFVKRAQGYLAVPPPDDWDGINSLDRK